MNKEYYHNYYIKHKNKIKKKHLIYYNLNKSKIIKQQLIYEKNNIEKIRNYRKQYCKLKRKNDINYLLKGVIKSYVNYHLKKNNLLKKNNYIKYLECSIEFYKDYLESQFKNGMTWNNYGILWEIDHIKPTSKFNLLLESNLKQCFHYSNTQPMLISKNRSKSNKVIISEVEK